VNPPIQIDRRHPARFLRRFNVKGISSIAARFSPMWKIERPSIFSEERFETSPAVKTFEEILVLFFV
jgi:hypothetical protein